MARYECSLGEDVIAEGDTLDELRDNLEWQLDEDRVNAVECYDTERNEFLDICDIIRCIEPTDEDLELLGLLDDNDYTDDELESLL